MRICLISREYPPDTGWGGIGAYTFQHAQALKASGHEVEVIALTTESALTDKEPELGADLSAVPVYRAVWSPLLQELTTLWISAPYAHYTIKCSLALWQKFLARHNEKPFDVVEAPEHLAEALLPALTRVCPLVLRLHTPHAKFIQERYHNITPSFDQRLVAILERTAMLEATLLSSPSRDLAKFVATDCGIDLSTIEIVSNPVDTVKFCPEGPLARPADGRATVFFAGRLEERKGITHLIAAVPAILSSCPNTRFIVVGADTNTGPRGSSVLAALKEQLAANGAASAVEFVSHVKLSEMPDFYRSADICVVPSLYENAPYTVLEAQSTGKPVVGTAAGGTPEYVAHEDTGIVVPAANPQALAEAIIDLLENPEKRSQMGVRARERTLALYDRNIIAREALRTYETAIARHEKNKAVAIYRKGAEKSLDDFVSLLCSYHLSLCDLIYRHSLTFRLRHWLDLALKRPRLFAAKLSLHVLRLFNKALAATPMSVEDLVQKIQTQVQEKELEKQESFYRHIMQSIKTAVPVAGHPDKAKTR